MPVSGSLTKEKFGFSMPVYAPLYPKPPYLYRDATLIKFEYQTIAELAARMVPAVDGLSLADPPTAGLVFARYPWSTLGPYDEVVLYLDVVFKGQPLKYAAFLYVTTDAAMAAGREMGGYPKKIGRIEFLPGPDPTAVLERPAGLRICTGTMRPEVPLISGAAAQKPATPIPPLMLNYLTLRVIPSPQLNEPPTLAELLQTHWAIECTDVWSGPGSCQFTGASELDPLHWAPVKDPLVNPPVCQLIKGNISVSLNDRPSETLL